MNPTNQPVSFYGDNSRSTDGALLAALATKDYSYDEAGMLGAYGVSDLRSEVKDVGANVREAIRSAEANVRSDVRQEGQEAVSATKDVATLVRDAECRVINKLGEVECKIIKENSDQTLYLTNQLSVIREQGIRNEYETKLSREQAIKEISAKVDHESERTNDKVQFFKDFTAEKFCDLEKQLQHCCCEQELAAANIQSGIVNIQNLLNSGPGNS